MIFQILSFELNFWKKRVITYVFPLIVFIISLLLFTVENVSFGSDIVYRNSPSSLSTIYYVFCIFLPLFINSFVSSGVTRDYENKFDQIIYSLPVSKTNILIGRFIGGCLVVSLIFIGVLFADILAPFMPWANKDILGSFRLDSHIQNFFMVALPNIFIIGSVLFLISSWTKNLNYSFLGAISLVVILLTLQSLNNKIDNKTIIALTDPYGFEPIRYFTNKWSAYEKNNYLFKVDWRFWINRALWIGFSLLLWVIALQFNKFNFGSSKKKKEEKLDTYIPSQINLQSIQKDFSWKYLIKNLHYQAKIDFLHIIKSPAFYVVIGLIFMILVMTLVGMIQSDDFSNLATTNNALEFLSGISTMMKLAVIYFSGMLIWKERDNKIQDIFDSMPIKTGAIYIGKLLSIVYLMIMLSTLVLFIGVFYQLFNGIYLIDWSHYFLDLFVFDLFDAITLAILAMFFQIIINNKFIAYFFSCILIIAESFILEWIDISSNMFSISPSLPNRIFSDFYGYGIYKTPIFAFMLYWILIYSIIGYISYLLFVRGKMNQLKERLAEAKMRFGHSKLIFLSLLIPTILYAGFLYYQTKIVNTYFSKKEKLLREAYYEKNFKKLAQYPSPKVVHVDYKIDLFPSERKFEVKSKMNLVNTSDTLIDKLYINNDLDFPYNISIQGVKMVQSDKNSTVDFQTYQLVHPLKKGDSIELIYVYKENYGGIENEIKNNRLVSNGTFLDFSNFTPILGYNDQYEIEDKSDREKHKLPVKAEGMPELERNCTQNCMKDYIGGLSDWATIHTIISTEENQMAIAPGTLIKQWKEDHRDESSRNYFEYNLSQPSKFFFSIVSGNFEVMRDTSRGVKCEVYYLADHTYNVAEMMKALKRSIAYYSDHFGPYKHTEARIIEFPKFAYFAQAFPGTMPYSEGIGFTSNLVENPKDINQIFHVVAHEMAHQWWAHQVTGARMQGATILSESLAEYSSLKLMEREYGLDMTTKFLKKSNNGYVFSRAQETKKESALFQVDNQGYIRYQKGSVVLYGIQQLIGESKFNIALHNLILNYAYKNPPYPTSYALLDELYTLTPDSLKETVKDGLERIIIFHSDIKSAQTKQLADKSFETIVNFTLTKNTIDPNAKQSQKIKDIAIGQSKEAPVQDYFDIGLYQKTDDKIRYGNKLSVQRFYLNKKENTIKLISKIKPDKIVLDPYFIHIHKDPEDNIKKL